MFQRILLTLMLSLTIQNQFAHAQPIDSSGPVPDKAKSCSEQIRIRKNKMTDAAEKVLTYGAGGVGLSAVATFAMAGPILLPVYVGGAAVVGAGVLISLTSGKRRALKIFEGASLGGNKQTLKLWNMANKKDPEVFRKITYQNFLNSIQAADESGEACRVDGVPNKKEFISAIKLEMLDTADEGESDSPAASGDNGSRGLDKKENDLQESTIKKITPPQAIHQ